MQIKPQPLIGAFLLGLIASIVAILLVQQAGVGFDVGLEAHKYINPALGLLHTGNYVREVVGQPLIPELQRLPGYPTFLALCFKLFGSENYLAVVLLQSVFNGLTVLGIALIAERLFTSSFWYAVALAVLSVNLSYRASTLMPETFFVLLFTWAQYCLLSAPKRRVPLPYLLLGGLLLGCCALTRPVMLVFSFFSFPLYFYLLQQQNHEKNIKKVLFHSMLPFLCCLLCMGAQVTYIKQKTHTYAYTLQSGVALYKWLYPCLSTPWGCGSRDVKALQRADDLVKTKTAQFSRIDPIDLGKINQVQHKVGKQLVLSLPVLQVAKAGLGGFAKLLLHTGIAEVIGRIVPPNHPSAKIHKLSTKQLLHYALADGKTDQWLIILALAQAGLIASRLFALLGMTILLRNKATQRACLWFFSGNFAVLLTCLGLGNNRYRAPLEPYLIALAATGLCWCVQRFFFNDKTLRPGSEGHHVYT